jgi:DeoR family transcriptional regulator, fructose operon transcriptional repressor
VFIEERLEKILKLLAGTGSLSVAEGAERLGVSPDTVRRDFARLTKHGVAVRTHGGLMSIESVSFDPAMKEKVVHNREEKEAIARAAADLVADAETIVLDAGTTTERIVRFLSERKDLTILTNALNIAVEATRRELPTIILGGAIRSSTLSITGPDAVDMIRHYHADKLFLGVSAVSLTKGLMTPNRLEAEIKRELMHVAGQVILLADSSKIHKTALYSFGSLKEVSALVTDDRADAEFLSAARDLGVNVVIAQTATADPERRNAPATDNG